ncbi:MAG: ATP cone domain-containing protein [Planctomycetota bacterium]
MSKLSPRDVVTKVRKQDAALEPFQIAKLRNSIRNALQSAGDPCGLDNAAANGLAEAIQDYMAASFHNGSIPSRQLLELVEVVLTQTGHAAAGLAIRQNSQTRDRQRRWQTVASRSARDGRFVQHRWNKGRLVASLRRLHSLDAPASRMIAGRVEQLIFNCGLKVVTSDLVREMANSELLAWGLLPGALVVSKKREPRMGKPVKDKTDTT